MTPTDIMTPTSPGDSLPRKLSIRDMSIGRPQLQSTTKNANSLQKMPSAGGNPGYVNHEVPGIPGPASFDSINCVINHNHSFERPNRHPERPPPPRTLQSPVMPPAVPPPPVGRDGYLVPVTVVGGIRREEEPKPQRPPTTYLDKVHIAPPPSPPPPPVKKRQPLEQNSREPNAPGPYENIKSAPRPQPAVLTPEKPGIFKTTASSYPMSPPHSLIGPPSEPDVIPAPTSEPTVASAPEDTKPPTVQSPPDTRSSNHTATTPRGGHPPVKKGPGRPPPVRSNSTAGSKPSKPDAKPAGRGAPRRNPTTPRSTAPTPGKKPAGQPAKPVPSRKAPKRPEPALGSKTAAASGKPAAPKPSVDRARKPSMTTKDKAKPPPKSSVTAKAGSKGTTSGERLGSSTAKC